MLNKTKTPIALGVVALFALTGCSSGASTGGKTTITMIESLATPTRTELLEKQIAEFEKLNPDIEVELLSPPVDSADTQIQNMLQVRDGSIDVLEVDDTRMGSYINNDWLYDMAPDLQGWSGYDELTDTAKQFAINEKGQTYFIPFGFYGASLYYRTDLIQDEGYTSPPATWDEVLAQGTDLNDPDDNEYGYAFRGSFNAANQFAAVLQTYNVENLDTNYSYRLNDGRSIFATDESKAAATMYFDLFKKASSPSSISWGYPEMVEAFNNGSTAFLIQDPEVIATIQESSQISEEQWTTAPLPVGPSGKAARALATGGWGVANDSDDKEAAVELVKFLTSGDKATEFSKTNSLIPATIKATEDTFFSDGPWAGYANMASNPETYVTTLEPRGVSWWTEWATMSDSDIQQVLIGEMSVEELLTKWDTYWVDKWKDEAVS